MDGQDTFSPYLDPEPVAGVFDDFGQRYGLSIMIALILHLLLFLFLKSPFKRPEDPDPILIKIISFNLIEDIQPEPDPVFRPAVPDPAQAPTPTPKPVPPLPSLPPEPKPLPEPEPVLVSPLPEILRSETVEPDAVTPPAPVPQPVPEPVVKQSPEPAPESVPESISEPPDQPEYIPDLVAESFAVPEIGLVPAVEPAPDLLSAPVITESDPVSGTATDTLIPEPVEPAPLIQQSIPEPLEPVTPPTVPDVPDKSGPETLDTAPVTSAPKILASPDAPTSQQERERSVPESQRTPLDYILEDGWLPGSQPSPGKPRTSPLRVGGGTRRANPGAGGWVLAPGSTRRRSPGYEGLIIDIRCREEKRTHEDCPNYVLDYRGRNAQGFENLGPHASRGVVVNTRSSGSISGGERNGMWNGATTDTSGRPSTTVLDDTYLPTYDPGIAVLGGEPSGAWVRDVFGSPDPVPWTLPETLPELPEEEKNRDPLKIPE